VLVIPRHVFGTWLRSKHTRGLESGLLIGPEKIQVDEANLDPAFGRRGTAAAFFSAGIVFPPKIERGPAVSWRFSSRSGTKGDHGGVTR